MATRQQIYDAILAADKAGRKEDVVTLGTYLRTMPDDAPTNAPAQPMTLGEVAKGALSNAGPSAVNLAKNLVQPILHPIDTAKAIGTLGASALGKIGIGDASPEAADAVGGYFADRYGGVENIKRTMATDPAGLAMDASAVLSGGGAAAARLPGVVGRVGQAAYTAGRAIDPVANTAKLAVAGGKLVAPVAKKVVTVPLGMTTGAGSMAIEEGFKAGVKGGKAAEAFTDNMRGNVPMEAALEQAKVALGNMRQDRSAAYKAGMAGVASDPTVLAFAPIDKAVDSVRNRGFYKGKVTDASAADTWQKIDSVIADWKASDPAEFHTPEGFDALKRAVGDIRDAAPYGTPSRNAADAAYNAIKDQITAQAPSYAKVMKEYEQASTLLKEIETALSLGKKASADTALRKLQSITRNNANTNYGKRVELAETLAKNGAPNLMPALAGQAMSAVEPRGLARVGALVGGGALGVTNPALLPTLFAASPRAVGEAAYYAGRGVGPLRAGGRAAAPFVPAVATIGQVTSGKK